MEYKYDETRGLYKRYETNTGIYIKSIEVGKKINVEIDLQANV